MAQRIKTRRETYGMPLWWHPTASRQIRSHHFPSQKGQKERVGLGGELKRLVDDRGTDDNLIGAFTVTLFPRVNYQTK